MTTNEIYTIFKQIASVNVICRENKSRNFVVPIQTNDPDQLKRDIDIIGSEQDFSIKWLHDEDIPQDAIPDNEITESTDNAIAPAQLTYNDSYSIINHQQFGSEKVYLHSFFRVYNASEHVISRENHLLYEGKHKTNQMLFVLGHFD